MTNLPDPLPALGITAEEAAIGRSLNPPRRGKRTTVGIDAQLQRDTQHLLDELAKLARVHNRVDRLRKRILRLRALRMTATNPAAKSQEK